jgi:hypothetical protein
MELSELNTNTLRRSRDINDIYEARGALKVIEDILALSDVIKEYQKGLKTTGPGGMTTMKKVG